MMTLTTPPSFEFSTYTTTPKAVRRSPTAEDTTLGHLGHYDRESLITLLANFCTAHEVQGDIRGALSDFFAHFEEKYKSPAHTSVWASLRLEKPSGRREVTRPHHDGQYWGQEFDAGGSATEVREDRELPFKVGTVFVGPGTLFWDANPPACTPDVAVQAQRLIGWDMDVRAKAAGTNASDDKIRQWAHEELEKLGVHIVSPTAGQAVKWTVGSRGHGGIHSEPNFSHMPDGRVL